MNISRIYRKKGIFWNIDEDEKIEGELFINRQGEIRLGLNKPLEGEVINGLIDNKPITLLNVVALNSGNIPSQIERIQKNKPPIEMRAKIACIGEFYHNKTELINEVKFSFDIDPDFFKNSAYENYEKNLQLNETAQIKLHIKNGNLLIYLLFEAGKEINEVMKFIRYINLFFTFIFNNVLNLKNIWFKKQYLSKTYYDSLPQNLNQNMKNSSFLKIVDLPNLLETIIKWVSLYDSHWSSLNLYLGYLTNKKIILDLRFLMLAQAIEGFHREEPMKQNDLDEEVFEKLKGYIMSWSQENNHKIWLENKMKHLNDISFRNRIKMLFESLPLPFKINKVKGEIVDTRNLLTHVSADLKIVYEEDLLFKLVLKMDIMFCYLLLQRIGFNEESLGKIAENYRIKSLLGNFK